MIVIDVKLVSVHGPHRDQNLGTMVIDNIGGTQARGDYRCRMYAKGVLPKHGNDPRVMVHKAKHTRESTVLNHARLAEPVHNLVAKALTAMGYK
jgi:hypothetical protein